MAQNKKPDVDALFARMLAGTKSVEDKPGGEDREENPPAKKTAAKKGSDCPSSPSTSSTTGWATCQSLWSTCGDVIWTTIPTPLWTACQTPSSRA